MRESHQYVHEMVGNAMRRLGSQVEPEGYGPLVDSMLAVAERHAAAADVEEFAVTAVTVTPGMSPNRRGKRQLAAAPVEESGHWPFPFSGKICVWYCPDGGPYEEDYCYLICIEWWFPLAPT